MKQRFRVFNFFQQTMSQLLGRIAKLSSSSQRLCFGELRRLSTAATPYLLLDETNRRAIGGGATVVDMNLYDPRKDERVKIPDQTLSMELRGSVKIGSSRGWVGLKNMLDSTMRLTNMFNPCASVSSHKVITLPPLDDKKARICSISLSASPDQQDCVVAARSTNSSLRLCRPGDSHWTPIKFPFFAKEVMYSVRDRKFYLHMTPREEEYEGPVDLLKASSGFPQVSLYQRFPISDIPESRQDQVTSTFETQFLVESPSGDSFIVYWCYELLNREEIDSTRDQKPPSRIFCRKRRKTRAFVVFRQDPEQKIASYTDDIGDLCIFLGWNEAFCVSATEYPGLNPNSVYYTDWDTGSGFYDLSSNTLHDVIDPRPFSSIYHWLGPLQ